MNYKYVICILENASAPNVLDSPPKSLHPDWREFACGCGAAIINITITYPINKLIFRQVTTLISLVLLNQINTCTYFRCYME